MSTRTHLRAAAFGVALAGILLATSALAGCSGASSDSAAASSMDSASAGSAADAGGSYADEATSEAASSEAAMPASASNAADSSAGSAGAGSNAAASALLVTGRQIIRTADVTLKIAVEPNADEKSASPAALADAATRAAHAVRALATLPGAYVSGSDGHGATVTVTLRVPAGSYDSVMGRLADIGTVTAQSEATQDVTGEMVDVASRIETMQASVDRLRALMTDADSMKDVIAIESELTTRQADLESLQRRQAELSDQVTLSTISVTVNAVTATTTVVEPKPVDRSAFVSGVLAGWHGLATVGRGTAAVLGAILPFLLPLALAGIGGWLVVRKARRSRPKSAPISALEDQG
ncbi:MAG: DUF4349 domain-containing protein [Nakamurella sp.]